MKKLFFAFAVTAVMMMFISCEKESFVETDSQNTDLVLDSPIEKNTETDAFPEISDAREARPEASFLYTPVTNLEGKLETLVLRNWNDINNFLTFKGRTTKFLYVTHLDGSSGYIPAPTSRSIGGCEFYSNGSYHSVWRSVDSGMWYLTSGNTTTQISSVTAAQICKKHNQ